jgi:hypothetical protein
MRSDPLTATTPPETIDEAAISVDRAARLMADLGFVAFRTPPDTPMPGSCLMAVIRDTPTRTHFDPEVATFWVLQEGHGRLQSVDRATSVPHAEPYSWGRILLVDRYGMRNGFVSFGGLLTIDRVGPDARLLIFRSPAPILRLRGHSQRQDRLADDVLAFFARLAPRLWTTPLAERFVATTAPEILYAAFLLHEPARRPRSTAPDPVPWEETATLRRELEQMARSLPELLTAGRALLVGLGLAPDGAQR